MAVGQDSPQIPGEKGTVTEKDVPVDSVAGEDIWDEEQIEKALKIVKEMHIQLRGLRTTIPRLIAPLTTKQPSPESLFREFSSSASTANQEVQQFRRLMGDVHSIKALEQSRKSRAENPNGIRSWKVIEHPDWLTRDASLES